MKNTITILFLLIGLLVYSQSITTDTGIIFKKGDTIRMGQPLSHLGWREVFTAKDEDYVTNKNLINKDLIIRDVNTKEKTVTVVYKRRKFYININEALRNKEVIPQFKRELVNQSTFTKYNALRELKSLLDDGIITKEEYNLEKKKLLEN